MFHQFSDDPLRIVPVDRMGNIHDLTRPVDGPPLLRLYQHIRMGFYHPCGHRISGRPHDHMNARFFHGVQNPFHMGKIKYTLLRFAGTPRGFRDPHRVDPRLLHHPDVFRQPFAGHILVIISRPE